MRKLGLDIGTKSCGFAISDVFNLSAHGIANFTFNHQDWNALLEKVKEFLSQYQVDTIVVGYPTFPSGDKPKMALIIDQFVEILRKNLTQEIILINENQTTKRALKILKQASLSSKKQKLYKDQIAAQLILEDYLNTIL